MKLSTKQLKELNHLTCKSPQLTSDDLYATIEAMPQKTSFTFNLDAGQQDILTELLAAGNYRPKQVPFTRIAVEAPSWKCNVSIYTSGKCLIQGAGAEEFILNIDRKSVV